ncbi:MAG: hypothetical protein K1X79_05005 [Oligoflexia bacterium]|nr:hypothetical protein [Oligoflexia bacterium]
MLGKPGPFQIIESEGSGLVDAPMSPPRRRYACSNYHTCLDLAAALNWDNFTCRGCCGDINESLYWRAHQASKKDSVIQTLCEIPNLQYVANETATPSPELVKLVVKR